jgi:iron(II)-dependent oxidoreductase
VPLDRAGVVSWYQRNRARSRALFDLVEPAAYYRRPIPLRQPVVFYDGHLPAFSFNTLVKKALGGASIDPSLETLFARGIDPAEHPAPGTSHPAPSTSHPAPSTSHPAPSTQHPAPDPVSSLWPSRSCVREFAAEADRRVLGALEHADVERPGHPLLDRAEAVFAILEHEAMHQETLLYMWHRLPFAQKRRPSSYSSAVSLGPAVDDDWVEIPGGRATLGVNREAIPFGWDNEFPAITADVAPFAIERHGVTNARFLQFIDAGGYEDSQWWRPEDWRWIQSEGIKHPLFWERQADGWYWRGMFELIPLPLAWPVYVSQAEAAAFCRWRGARLPTEAEFQRAAFGTPSGRERLHPWGDDAPTQLHGVFDFSSWDPEPAGSHPAGASAWGVEDLVGNGWTWTSTAFAPFPGFRPMASYPEYSADFFDGEHFVIKGASPVTARELLRPTFRNWFRPRYPYVYATFRCVRPGSTGGQRS